MQKLNTNNKYQNHPKNKIPTNIIINTTAEPKSGCNNIRINGNNTIPNIIEKSTILLTLELYFDKYFDNINKVATLANSAG